MNPIFLILLGAIAAFAWNPPIAVCPPEAMKKIDDLAKRQSEGKLTGNYTIPFDNGKCFLHGFDIYVEGNNFGLANSKTGDKLKYNGKAKAFPWLHNDKQHGFAYGEECQSGRECGIALGNNSSVLIYSISSNSDTVSMNNVVSGIAFVGTKDSEKFFGFEWGAEPKKDFGFWNGKTKDKYEGYMEDAAEDIIKTGSLKRSDLQTSLKEAWENEAKGDSAKISILRNIILKRFERRNIKDYKTVKIGEQVWMAENLNEKVSGSECYNYEESSCKKYGRLYSFNIATMICPEGSHLPTDREWAELMDFVGGFETAGKFLKAKSSWNTSFGKSKNGTDKFGFAALPGGCINSGGGFSGFGNEGYWWEESGYYRGIGEFSSEKFNRSIPFSKKEAKFSVRCIKD